MTSLPTGRLARLGIFLIGLCSFTSGVLHAQAAAVTPEDEFKKKIRVSEDIQPLGENPFGEQISLYNGSNKIKGTCLIKCWLRSRHLPFGLFLALIVALRLASQSLSSGGSVGAGGPPRRRSCHQRTSSRDRRTFSSLTSTSARAVIHELLVAAICCSGYTLRWPTTR